MAYPDLGAYQAAVQNPSAVFLDPLLKQCAVETTPLGLPRPRTGGFAITYRLMRGSQSWAVRCFHKQAPDLEARYAAISDFLQSKAFPHFVDFTFVSQGIRVQGQTLPVVKMAWITGQTLEIYLDQHHADRRRVSALAQNIADAVRQLEQHNAAHGDLQHGNILARDDGITLIDYDGMYVPSMPTGRANEIGHVNYQSPLRDESAFGPGLDRFASIVMALALEALQHQPSLWGRFSGGDNLLFRRSDFVNPQASQLLKELRILPNFASRIDQFSLLCRTPFTQMPTLDQFMSGAVSVSSSQILSQSTPVRVRLHQFDVVEAANRQALLSSVGDVVQVVGRVVNVARRTAVTRQPYAVVDFGDWKEKQFRLVLWAEQLDQLENVGTGLNSLAGKWVTITGLVQVYNGSPQIVVDDAYNVRILPQGKADAERLLDEGQRNVTLASRVAPVTASGNAAIVQRLRAMEGNVATTVTLSGGTMPAAGGAVAPTNKVTRNQKIVAQLRAERNAASPATAKSIRPPLETPDNSNWTWAPSRSEPATDPSPTKERRVGVWFGWGVVILIVIWFVIF